MTAPTREQKWNHLYADIEHNLLVAGLKPPDDIDAAILADYAPLSDERRAELEARRRIIAKRLDDEQRHQNSERCMDRVPSAASDQQYAFFEAWLAELDAELEGGDA